MNASDICDRFLTAPYAIIGTDEANLLRRMFALICDQQVADEGGNLRQAILVRLAQDVHAHRAAENWTKYDEVMQLWIAIRDYRVGA